MTSVVGASKFAGDLESETEFFTIGSSTLPAIKDIAALDRISGGGTIESSAPRRVDMVAGGTFIEAKVVEPGDDAFQQIMAYVRESTRADTEPEWLPSLHRFWHSSPALVPVVMGVRFVLPDSPVEDDDADRAVDDEPRSKAFKAFRDIVRWTQSTNGVVADLLGIGRTTPNSWERDGREPHRGTVKLLFQIHNALAAVVHELGEERAIDWLCHDDPRRVESVLAGDLDAIERDLDDLLFRPRRPRRRRGAWIPEDEA
jgi:transcriptional regulator with XRE-family HTH domain